MKTKSDLTSETARRPVAARTDAQSAAVGGLTEGLQSSARMAAQRKQIAAAFGQPVQREEEANANLTGMPDELKSGVESLSGMDLSDVRVHRNSPKPAQLNALAYAQGNDIHLGPGEEQHLPHEAWHLVQQRQGRVQPTTQLQGVAINDDAALEEEADVMGAKAIQRVAMSIAPAKDAGRSDAQGPVVQRTLFLTSQSGRYPYDYGGDFTRDHIGDQQHAIAVLRQRYQDRELTSPVTVITQLDGNHDGVEVAALKGYDFSIVVDAAGWTASWNDRNQPVTVAITSVTLSGFFTQKGKRGLITHISSAD
ncbi:DUF4157 domain-containing protein [Piscinibacter sp.]|uniref:eCIS core domain-containing protein n=1 Tax=Piscinibacter sp. TaxID=1903157 RepID=UPI002C0919FD|nr:DUF4157 domain-containing protein [Albitalea sp.]HUG24380.1 DUF4157 domain-containing protein [Albitalea sp.]